MGNGGQFADKDVPDVTMSEARNYCREVGDVLPWCYVYTETHTQATEWCDLTDCASGKLTNNVLRYRSALCESKYKP